MWYYHPPNKCEISYMVNMSRIELGYDAIFGRQAQKVIFSKSIGEFEFLSLLTVNDVIIKFELFLAFTYY